LDDAFSPATPDDEVLFEVAVTKAWLRQVIVGLTLICRSSYRGVVEFLRDLLGLPVSLGCVHDVLEAATRQASAINHDQDLSRIRWACTIRSSTAPRPCWPVSMPSQRIAISWRRSSIVTPTPGACTCWMPLGRGCSPTTRSADAGQGLRAGQKAAWGDTPCQGDVFHIQRRCEGLAEGAASPRQTLQAKTGRAGQRGPDDELAAQLARAQQSEAQASWLVRGNDQGRWLWACLSARVPTQAVLPMFQKLVTWHGNVPVTVFRHAEGCQ